MKRRTTKNTKRNTNETLAWLQATTRRGVTRIQTLSWGRLNRIYRSGNAVVRRTIEREAQRCGYRPQTILSLNAWA